MTNNPEPTEQAGVKYPDWLVTSMVQQGISRDAAYALADATKNWADSQLRDARAEAAEYKAKAELADKARPWMQLALQECVAKNLILHIPIYRNWVADYDALEKGAGGT